MTTPPPEITIVLFPGTDEASQAAWGFRSRVQIEPEAVALLDPQTAEEYLALPIRRQGRVLTVAMADPEDATAIGVLSQRTGLRIRPALAEADEIRQALLTAYTADVHASAPAAEPIHFPLGWLLIERGLITLEQLQASLTAAKRTKERLGRLVVTMGYVNRLALAEVLAEQYHLPAINLRQEVPAPKVVRLVDQADTRRLLALPVRWVGSQLLVAVADPSDQRGLEELKQTLGVPLQFGVTSEQDIEWVLARAYSATYMEESVAGLLYRTPEESAYETFTDAQIALLIGLLTVGIIGLLAAPLPLLIGINAIAATAYFAVSAYRLWLSFRGARADLTITVTPEEIAQLDEAELPVITMLVPLYHEHKVLPQLIEAIDALDYPKARLDVKLLFEENDRETSEAAKAMHPPGYFTFVTVPDRAPRTKPKACNYGLISARGQFTVILDAEDKPEPDQLKRVVVAFRRAPEDVICLQAKLNYYNRNQSFLTRWFTTEYSNWFDLILPGLDSARAPIPLGGTSNYFYTEKLRALGAWDPFNVTEDADLGIRMYKHRYRTAIIDSTTFEEANSDVGNWIRQRSRWVKGYMQTWLVHMRRPLRLLRDIGPRAFLSLQMTVGGTPLVFLLNPIYWGITTLWFLGRWNIIPLLFPSWVYYLGMFNLLVGNFLFVYLNLIGAIRRGYFELARSALLSPMYWLLMSIGAWKALWQLVTKPYYWEKTIHGLHRPQPAGGQAD